MNKVFWMGIAILGLSMTSVSAAEKAPAGTTAMESQSEGADVANKTCPISHEEIGKGGMEPDKVTYNGKTYSLCCSMCEKDFNKDPEKYTKLMEEEAAQGANK